MKHVARMLKVNAYLVIMLAITACSPATVTVTGLIRSDRAINGAHCLSGFQIFTASDIFVPPSCAIYPLNVRVLVVGSGGGAPGGGGSGGSGAGSGVVGAAQVTLNTPAVVPITIAAAGLGVPDSAAANSGGSSSFGGYLTMSGGSGGSMGPGGAGGSGGGLTAMFNSGAGGANGSNGAMAGGSGQGPIVTSSTTVLGITFNLATFSSGLGGVGGVPGTPDGGGGQGYGAGGGGGDGTDNFAGGGGGGGILINGLGPTAQAGTAGTGGSGANGVVYVEW